MKIPYTSAVGSLMYAMVCTRPDIGYAVGVLSRFMSNPGKEHWNAVKWILQYLKGTLNMCLRFGSGKPVLDGFTDSDMSVDVDTNRSTSGCYPVLWVNTFDSLTVIGMKDCGVRRSRSRKRWERIRDGIRVLTRQTYTEQI